MVEHLVMHPAKAAPAFFDAMEVGKTLDDNRVARAGPVFPFAKAGEGERFSTVIFFL